LSKTVDYALPGSVVAAFQRSHASQLRLDPTVARLRAAIESAGLWVLHEIDPQALLRRGGYAIHPARQVLFFHPRYLAGMLAADPTSLLEAPLKIAVIESSDGGVALRWADPVLAFSRYRNAALASLGQELAMTCEMIVAAAAGESDPANVQP
jgi:uncharacterized protein (DUF302 family)